LYLFLFFYKKKEIKKTKRNKKMHINYKIGDKDIRPWGTWETIDIGETYIIKKIIVNPYQALSLQMHTHRNEHWIMVQGSGFITLGENTLTLSENNSLYIPKQTKHRIANKTNKPICFIEIQTGNILDENDIIRFSDIYGRLTKND